MKRHAPAKINTFLKIIGKRGAYHELASRFVQVPFLYDDIWFEPKSKREKGFELVGDFGCATEKNTIYKAFIALSDVSASSVLQDFFEAYRVCVHKNIPECAGLGGGSSDAASFLLLCNDVLALGYSKEALAKIGERVGADVPFFVYDVPSANVTGIGEVIEPFREKPLSLEVMTPSIACSTPEVFKAFREHYWETIDVDLAKHMLTRPSEELCQEYAAEKLNDLFLPAIHCHRELKQYLDEGWMMSGSGSTMFRINHG